MSRKKWYDKGFDDGMFWGQQHGFNEGYDAGYQDGRAKERSLGTLDRDEREVLYNRMDALEQEIRELEQDNEYLFSVVHKEKDAA